MEWTTSDAWIATRCSKPKTLRPLSPPTTKTTSPPLKTFPALRVRFSKSYRYHLAMLVPAVRETSPRTCDPILNKPDQAGSKRVMTPFRIVAIGGGTGLSTLLHGLKRYALEPREVEITAIVTVTDDGGSSGRLRREFDVLPPGDIRNCMVALSEDEALLSKLFQYRFSEGRGLKGHSFGNLFLMALTHVMGDFPDAVKASSEVLNIAGRIFPATAANVALEATLANGVKLIGETRISRSKQPIQSVRLRP